MRRLGYILVTAIIHSWAHAQTTAGADAPVGLQTVTVIGVREQQPAATADTADLLRNAPGVSFYRGGGVSSLPVIHGLNDDRINTVVDGMPITSACANHMNPALSYIAPAQVGSIAVFAGITPVSQGGDSIAGTIEVQSPEPFFAGPGQGVRGNGQVSAWYRSQGDAAAASFAAALADDSASLGYSGAVAHANSYRDGRGDKVRSTQYETRNHALTFALRGVDDQLTVRLGQQRIPYQGFVNQYMDMVDNHSDSINVRYRRDFAWGNLDARLYWQDVKHKMDFFSSEKTGDMPMKTHGRDLGYAVRLELPRAGRDTVRIGHDFHRFTLNDFWPPVPGSMMMEPDTYENINHGRRDRFGVFAEWESRWSEQWSTQLGIRDDLVRMNTGDVQPYNPQDPIPMGMGGMGMGMDNPDAAAALAFNARSRARADNHVDLTASARYQPGAGATYEFGYARKTRSPSLYERYSWGRGTMAMTMIGWFGDANAYVGNPDLKPETAHTLSATADWHDAARARWQLQVTPYFTYVKDYIDVENIGTFHPLMAMQVTRPQLQLRNRDAELYGVDVSGQAALWSGGGYGRGLLKGVLGWTRGVRVGSGENLYHIMPLNARVSLEQSIAAWTNTLEVEAVARKSKVDPLRDEAQTGGHALVNLRTAYQWRALRVEAGVGNLFNTFYYLPLGGVDYADWKAAGATGRFGSVPGAGRSLDVGLTLTF